MRRHAGRIAVIECIPVLARIAVLARAAVFAGLVLCAGAHPACAGGPGAPSGFAPATLERARNAREAGLGDDVGYDVLRSLTTRVGPRPAGSAADGRAVAWALETLRGLGFANVHAESVSVPHWVRGEARAEIASPWPQPLASCALGGSVGTPPEGVEGEVVAVGSIDDLKAMDAGAVRGKIVFFRNRMERSQSGMGYGRAVAVRSRGAAEAARLGAAAVVIRSIGTDDNRLPHTGMMEYDSTGVRIPALAISAPDADLLDRELAEGGPVRLRLWNTSRQEPDARSANVIGEFPARDSGAGIVLLGAHLDSWDLGQGAEDDGAGVATMIAAARLAAAGGALRHTIRVVLFANEEFGTSGARGYAAAHAGELPRHVLAMESDLGAFAITGIETGFGPGRDSLTAPLVSLVAPLGAGYAGSGCRGDADTGPLARAGVPVLELLTDASAYFDLHHSANDTFDKVNPGRLRGNIAGYAALTVLAASGDVNFGRLPEAAP